MKNKHFIYEEINNLIVTFLIFFGLCGFVVSTSFFIFLQDFELQKEQIEMAAKYTCCNIIFITLFFVIIDITRRKITINLPVGKIRKALEKVTKGDYTVRLETNEFQNNFTQIMESINQMTEELSGVETLRCDFIANVSHELKTPIAVIQNYGTLLQSEDLSKEQRLEYAKSITNTSKKLADLITNILRLNRLENQQIYPDTSKYNLSEQLCEGLLAFESVWEDCEIEIDTQIEEDIMVNGDMEILNIVWNNLFSNAFKFTPKGGKVLVCLKESSDFVIVKVSDTGHGMSPEVGKHIFDKFYQGDTSHATQGNGLGLSLVKRIIDIIGGEISVSSTLGVGSTFTVKLKKGL